MRVFNNIGDRVRAALRHAADESGIAMMTAMGVIAVTGLLSVVAVQVAFHSESTTSVDRARVVATSAAEAGVDLTLVKLKGTGYLPCSLTGNLPTSPMPSKYTVDVKYYATYPPVGAPLACDATTGPAAEPKAALISSDGAPQSGGAGARRMEALTKINLIPSNGFDKAIFADTSLTIANSTHISGNSGNDANVYANAPITCGNSIEVFGSIISQFPVTLQNSCKVLVDVYAKGNVLMQNSSSVGFDVKSSQGNIVAENTARIGRDAIALGTITGAAIGAGNPVRYKVPNATIPDPPYQPLPTINFDSAAWTTAGYTIVSNNVCSGTGSVYTTISSMATATVPKVLVTDCKITYTTSSEIKLNQNFAIFAKGGFHFKNTTTWKNMATPAQLRLYLIVPTGSTCTAIAPSDTGQGNIVIGNSTEFPDMDVFFYTPCAYEGSNSTHFNGQVYGKNVKIVNSYEMKFVPLPVHGATGGGGPSTYSAEVVYKREDVAGS